MVRHLFILLSLVMLSSAKCDHGKTSVQQGETTTISTVFITTTGSKYHNGNCRSVKKSKISISLKDAVARGYEPCKLCHPPVVDSITQ